MPPRCRQYAAVIADYFFAITPPLFNIDAALFTLIRRRCLISPAKRVATMPSRLPMPAAMPAAYDVAADYVADY